MVEYLQGLPERMSGEVAYKNIMQLEQYIFPFLEELDITHNSKLTYRRCMNRFFVWLRKISIDQLRKEHIIRYKEYLDKLGLKPFTRSTYLVAVRRFFEWLEAHLIYPNIAKGIKGIRKLTKSHSKDSLSIELIKKLLNSIDQSSEIGKRDYMIIFLLVHTGLRLVEISQALISDIELSESGKYILWVRGKGREGKDAFVVLSENVMSVIQEYLFCRKVKLHSKKPLFSSLSPRNKNMFMTTFSISRMIRLRMMEANIKTRRITAHSLRHTFGVLSIQAGASLYEVQLAMRHLSPQTTQVYLGDIEHKKRLEGVPENKLAKLLE